MSQSWHHRDTRHESRWRLGVCGVDTSHPGVTGTEGRCCSVNSTLPHVLDSAFWFELAANEMRSGGLSPSHCRANGMALGGDSIPPKCSSVLSLQQRGPFNGRLGGAGEASSRSPPLLKSQLQAPRPSPVISQLSAWVSHCPSQDPLPHLCRGLKENQ